MKDFDFEELEEDLSSSRINSAPAYTLTDEQSAAVQGVLNFTRSIESYAVLQGPAGTGKTYCLRALAEEFRKRVCFTAPTNKATKVLRETLTTDDYIPDCATIFSLLGLRMEPDGEVKVLSAKAARTDISSYALVVVDEASMIGNALWEHLERAAQLGVKFLFVGDPYQLPPVKEIHSKVWTLPDPKALTKVLRHDNAILRFATEIRASLDNFFPRVKFNSDNDGTEGIWVVSAAEMSRRIQEAVQDDLFSGACPARAVAWRNKTVDSYNRLIRAKRFSRSEGEMAQIPWYPEDRLILGGPVKDLDNTIIGNTDDEGILENIQIAHHPRYTYIDCYRLSMITDWNEPIVLWTVHPNARRAFQTEIDRRVAAAKLDRKLWAEYWEFRESFHDVRHGYALTAHRAQGSTYQDVFVDALDILANPNRHEAMRCLYVAITRARKRVFVC